VVDGVRETKPKSGVDMGMLGVQLLVLSLFVISWPMISGLRTRLGGLGLWRRASPSCCLQESVRMVI
jgi:hypothetical protein